MQQLSFPKCDGFESQLGSDALLKYHFPFLQCDICTQAVDQFLWIALWVGLDI